MFGEALPLGGRMLDTAMRKMPRVRVLVADLPENAENNSKNSAECFHASS
jgi:hypothetical protein